MSQPRRVYEETTQNVATHELSTHAVVRKTAMQSESNL